MKKGTSKEDYIFKRAELRDRLQDLEFVRLPVDEKAKILGVSRNCCDKYLKELEQTGEYEEILKNARKKYAREFLEVDAAMFQQAKGGNVEAAKTVYQKYEGWSPKQTNENINRNPEVEGLSDEELLKKALEMADKEALAKALAQKQGEIRPEVVEDKAVGE